jgi:hypothetical protein
VIRCWSTGRSLAAAAVPIFKVPMHSRSCHQGFKVSPITPAVIEDRRAAWSAPAVVPAPVASCLRRWSLMAVSRGSALFGGVERQLTTEHPQGPGPAGLAVGGERQ